VHPAISNPAVGVTEHELFEMVMDQEWFSVPANTRQTQLDDMWRAVVSWAIAAGANRYELLEHTGGAVSLRSEPIEPVTKDSLLSRTGLETAGLTVYRDDQPLVTVGDTSESGYLIRSENPLSTFPWT